MSLSRISQTISALLYFLLIINTDVCTGQVADSTASMANSKRLNCVLIGGSALYVTSMTGLYTIWYKDYPQSSFHFFNDSREWLQMDKAGHGTTAYYVSYLGYKTLRHTGLNEKKSILLGGLTSWMFLSTIEVFDGFSKQWGASVSDLTANTLGCAIFTGQQLLWNEQRFSLKWSYHPTDFPSYRPDLLGKSFAECIIKDYNGQTYWVSVNLKSFLSDGSKFPSWLNFSFGYGAEGMTGASTNSLTFQGNEIPSFERYRQFYFGPDIDLTRIKTRSGFLNAAFKAIGFIRLPLPALEFSSKYIKFHPFYF
jgi:hypothetical protein